MKTFKTKAGTELPLLNLKGKDYLQVQHRLVWFREERHDWGITTEFLKVDQEIAIAKATIIDHNGKIIAQGTKSETPAGFADYIEKAESGAIGRALAMCGYGTQFAQDLEEGERIVDSPAPEKTNRPNLQAVPGDPGAFVLKFGKYVGKRLSEIGAHDLDNYCKWLKGNAKPGQDDTAIKMMEAYLKTREVK